MFTMWQANLLIIMCMGMRSGKHSSEAAVSFPLKPWNDQRRASTRASPLYLAFFADGEGFSARAFFTKDRKIPMESRRGECVN